MQNGRCDRSRNSEVFLNRAAGVAAVLEDATNRDLLTAWRAGNEQAARVLVRRYMTRLTALARARLSRKLARRLDSEDIVLSAWRSFFTAAGRSQVSVPDDDDLWPLLVTMTLRKLNRQAARHSAARRSIEAEHDISANAEWQDIVASDPTPDEAALVTDQIEQLMSRLSPADREILSRRLQGDDQTAIAAATDCSERTVRRSLQRIRETFLGQQSDDSLGFDVAGTEKPGSTPPVPAARQRPSLPASFDYQDVVLEKLVGQGAFGRVYRSRQRDEQSPAAVKFLRKHLWRDPDAMQLLIDEVATVSALSHPGIVRHFGWGHTSHGAVFSVMEWIDGVNLTDWYKEQQPGIDDVVTCGIAVSEAVAAAHRAGILHADLTPANVLRRNDGRFVLTDFGFSHAVGASQCAPASGTPGFLAPEQLCDAFGTRSPCTDVYGIGGLLYFLLTGQPPASGATLADSLAMTLSGQCFQPPQELCPGIPNVFDKLICRCLSKEPTERPQGVDEIRRELERISSTCR